MASALAVLALLVRLGVALASGFQVDDAWITYRYAENLAAGEGFVYNPGERVYGTTTPLVTLLLALAARAGLPPPAASLALALVATGATVLLFAALAGRRLGAPWTVLLAGLLAAAPSHVVWSVSGMETAVFVAFLAAAVVAYTSGRWTLLGLAAAGAFLTRIDAVVLLAAIGVTEALLRVRGAGIFGGGSERPGDPGSRPASIRELASAAVAFSLAVAPWLAFAGLYFGTVVPNAVWAKTGLYRGLSFDRVPHLLRGALDAGLAPLPVEVALTVLGAAVLLGRRGRLAVAPIWLAGYALFLGLGQVHLHPWYLAPFHPWLLVTWVFGLAWVAGLLARAWERRNERQRLHLSGAPALAVALAAVIVAGAASVPAALYEAQQRQGEYLRAHVAIGRLLAAHTRPGERVYAWDVGYVGALSGRPILDFQGIVSPEVVPYNRRGDYPGVLVGFRPEWAVVGLYSRAAQEIFRSPEVRRLYREVYRNTPVGPEDVIGAVDPRPYAAEYVVLRRRDLS
jgi:hypothetical protein